jgi:hypothetical protein
VRVNINAEIAPGSIPFMINAGFLDQREWTTWVVWNLFLKPEMVRGRGEREHVISEYGAVTPRRISIASLILQTSINFSPDILSSKLQVGF